MPADRAAGLRAAAARKRELATARASAAMRELDQRGEDVTFQSVARHAGVSRQWLYEQPALRAEIGVLGVVVAPGGPWAGWIERIVCARAPSLTSVLVPGLAPGGDKMFDGVIPLGEALRPLSLSRRSTRRRPTCRQNDAGSRPRRIGMRKGLTRANDLLEEVRGLVCRPAGRLGCPIAEPKPGSSGQLIRVLVGHGTREPADAAA